jgi:hypothetical protein
MATVASEPTVEDTRTRAGRALWDTLSASEDRVRTTGQYAVPGQEPRCLPVPLVPHERYVPSARAELYGPGSGCRPGLQTSAELWSNSAFLANRLSASFSITGAERLSQRRDERSS